MTHPCGRMLVLVLVLLGTSPITGQEPEILRDPDAYALYGLLVPPYWSGRSKQAILLQRETENVRGCKGQPVAPNSDWQSAVENFHEQNTRVYALEPLLPTDTPYRLIPRAEIEADDARLALKYPGIWQRRPESLEYAAVSAVGFNSDKSKAVLYVRLRGRGDIFFMEKRDGQWSRAPVPACGWIA